ncbi:hypothetical protein LAD64_24180, partial [Klebsiella pneumoniae]|nr:hypothetical protein [Klebsiella pneumoniae]
MRSRTRDEAVFSYQELRPEMIAAAMSCELPPFLAPPPRSAGAQCDAELDWAAGESPPGKREAAGASRVQTHDLVMVFSWMSLIVFAIVVTKGFGVCLFNN